jgi:glutamine synthetase
VYADNGRNAFSLDNGQPAPRFSHYIAGLQHYLPDALLLLAPYVNSYRRLAPFTAAPINVEWGLTIAPAVCAFHKAAHKPAGWKTACLAWMPTLIWLWPPPWPAVCLACSRNRQRHRLIAAPMVGPMPLPAPSWRRWKGWPNQALATLLGPQFVSTYCQLKLSEWQEFNRQVTAWEYRHLLGQA